MLQGPHTQGHTFKHVLSYGLNKINVDTTNIGISDHSCIFFSLLCTAPPKNMPILVCSPVTNPVTANTFLDVFFLIHTCIHCPFRSHKHLAKCI